MLRKVFWAYKLNVKEGLSLNKKARTSGRASLFQMA